MELFRLKKELGEGKLQGLYIFFGEEYYVMNEYVKKIVESSGKEKRYIDTIGDITKYFNNKNIFNTNYVYICNDDKDILSSDHLWSVLRENKGNNIVILKFTNLDKRSKFYKENEEFITEFEKLGNEILVKHAINKIGLNQGNAQKLANRCNDNYGLMMLNGDKIQLLSKILGVNVDRSFEICVKDGLIPITLTNLGTEFVDCLLYKEYENIFFFKDLLIRGGEPLLQLVSLLYTNIRNVFLVQSCKKGENITQKTGLGNYLVDLTKSKVGIYKTESLKKGLISLRKAEAGLKMGTISEEDFFDDFLINFLFQEI